MSPFYILYDLRIAYSHLGSKEGSKEKQEYVKQRLGLSSKAGLFEIYETLINAFIESIEKLAKIVSEST